MREAPLRVRGEVGGRGAQAPSPPPPPPSPLLTSTTASSCPISTASPGFTATDTSFPGMGDISVFDVSRFCFAFMWAPSAWLAGVRTVAATLAPL